ncbi:hypothetical protein D3C75_631280 [compost metagenome]
MILVSKEGLVIILPKSDSVVQLPAVPEFHTVGVKGCSEIAVVAQKTRQARYLLIHISGRGCRLILRYIKRRIDHKLGVRGRPLTRICVKVAEIRIFLN